MSQPNIYNFVVRCEIDGEERNYLFDYVEDATTNLTSDITTHPLVNGDIIADHMYLNPATVNVAGTFSLLGNKKYNFGSTDRLANIQDIFERIMKEGIMCTLIKMNSDGDSSRFKVRENMVLTSISWVERQSSVDFNFGFNEALTAIADDVEYAIDVLDETLPIISDPSTLDVTDELLDINEIMQYTLAVLSEEELISINFLEDVLQWATEEGKALNGLKGALAGAAVGAVAGSVAVAAGLVAMLAICTAIGASIPVAGWIALAVIFAVSFVAGVVYGIIKGLSKSKYQIKRFKFYKNNEKKRIAENKRFAEFMGNLYLQFEQLEQNLSLYGFGQNTSQECLVTIDNNYYIFSFTKSTNNSNYSLEVQDIDKNIIANITNIAEKSIISLNDCNTDTILFTTPQGGQVYLANREILAKRQEGASNKEIEALQKDLTKYAILSSTLDLTKFQELMGDIIKSQIFK